MSCTLWATWHSAWFTSTAAARAWPATVASHRARPPCPATVPSHRARPRVVHQSRPRPRVRLASGAAGAALLGISAEHHHNLPRTTCRTVRQVGRTSRTVPLVLINFKASIFFIWKSCGSTGSTRLPRGSTPGSKVVLGGCAPQTPRPGYLSNPGGLAPPRPVASDI